MTILDEFESPSNPVPGRHAGGECADCGLSRGDSGWVEVVVHDAIWALIRPSKEGAGGLLCITCMARRLATKGLKGVKWWVTAGVFEVDTPDAIPGDIAAAALGTKHVSLSEVTEDGKARAYRRTEALKLVRHAMAQGHGVTKSIREAAASLGVGESTVRRWHEQTKAWRLADLEKGVFDNCHLRRGHTYSLEEERIIAEVRLALLAEPRLSASHVAELLNRAGWPGSTHVRAVNRLMKRLREGLEPPQNHP